MKALHQVYFIRCMRTRCRWCLECMIELEALIQTGEWDYLWHKLTLKHQKYWCQYCDIECTNDSWLSGKCWLLKRLFFIPATSTQAIPMTLLFSRWNYKKISLMIHSIHIILFLQFSKLAESVDLDVWSPACLPDQVSKFVCFPCT